MDRTLMGMETEFGFVAFDPSGKRLQDDEWVARLVDSVRRQKPSLRGRASHDVFLGSGSRLYVDCGHPEWATSEVTSPDEAIRYSRAGEQTLLEAATGMEQSSPKLGRVVLFKCNVDYVSGATWGAHENYLFTKCDLSELSRQITPHLASRVVFTGAGGLNPSSPGIDYSLSPRVERLDSDIGNRHAIFNTRDEPLAAHGFHRLHVVAGESICSHVSDYLRLGTTALILKLCDAGLRPVEDMALKEPLAATRAFASDPSCSVRVPVRHGDLISALEIQRRYLQQVESHKGTRFMPPWTDEVCTTWRLVLDALERDPAALDTVLDWPIKLAIFKQRARHHGIDWDALPIWNRALKCRLAGKKSTKRAPRDRDGLVAMLRAAVDLPDVTDALVEQPLSRGLSPSEFWESHMTLRAELCEIDIRFGQLGPQGVFDSLDRQGVLDHRISSDEEIAVAMDTPPTFGRGRVRGEQIKRLRSQKRKGICDWARIVDSSRNRILDLGDPFQSDTPSWKKLHRRDEPLELPDILTSPFLSRRRQDSVATNRTSRRDVQGTEERDG
jgi:proteasome accessory factor A